MSILCKAILHYQGKTQRTQKELYYSHLPESTCVDHPVFFMDPWLKHGLATLSRNIFCFRMNLVPRSTWVTFCSEGLNLTVGLLLLPLKASLLQLGNFGPMPKSDPTYPGMCIIARTY